ncbi:MAG: citrate synthase [Planctomycetota bacterium]
MTKIELVPGLAGIPAAESAVSFIDGQKGILAYRGIRIEELAEHSTFEETVYLLWYGELPTADQLSAFRASLAAQQTLPGSVVDMVRGLPTTGHPMQALQASVAGLGMAYGRLDLADDQACMEACLRLVAQTPVLIAAFERHRRGQEYVEPNPELSTAANFLTCLNGEQPDDVKEGILDCALVLHAEHTMNASTFACRVVASTENDPYTSTSGAVGTLFGPLHGGANERVLRQLEAIGGADKVEAWLEEKTANKGKVMGFGHRVYKTKDPRAKNLQKLVSGLFDKHGTTPLYDTALALEKAVVAKLGGKGIHPNVDFFSGIVYQKLGIATDMFTPIFALARMPGWLAHWREQMANNRLFRPGQIYVGKHDVSYVPMDQR